MATSAHTDDVVPTLWHAATGRGHKNPDWAETGRPQASLLNQSDYAALLRDRATDADVAESPDRIERQLPE